MGYTLRRLFLGIFLLGLASSVLLAADWRNRITTSSPDSPSNAAQTKRRIAIMQFSSRPILDEGVAGILEGLASKGYEAGTTADIVKFNAENDLPTANSIAKSIVEGGFDLVATASTPCLQTMASVNRDGRVVHVFGLVTDPAGAGVGIGGSSPLDHPKHLAGVGTFQPVEDLYRLARTLLPGLVKAGTVWNPGEACSEACMKKARAACKELGITLEEAQIDSSSGVFEAASSLASRGIQAFLIGGDNTVEMAMESVVRAATQARIPVFACAPTHVDAGVLAGLGANYIEVGRLEGQMAGEILNGLDPAAIEIKNYVPKKLALNLKALEELKEPWQVPPDVLASADIVIDRDGKRSEKPVAEMTPQTFSSPSASTTTPAAKAQGAVSGLTRKWNVQLLEYVESVTNEEAKRGLFEAWKEAGLEEGRDYELKQSNAQGDMASLHTLIDAAVSNGAELILMTSTPTLQAYVQKHVRVPAVFTNVADPVQAGAGKSVSDHLANVTGVSTSSDFEGMIEVVQACFPDVKKVGTLVCPAEVNSVIYCEGLTAAAKKAGIEMESVASSTSSEVPDAAASLVARDVPVICQISDNLHGAAFSSIVAAANRVHKPVFSFVSGLAVKGGAAIAVARDYEQGGRDWAAMALRVMRGEDLGKIPFTPVSKTRLVVNLPNAAAAGLIIPGSVINRADQVIRANPGA